MKRYFKRIVMFMVMAVLLITITGCGEKKQVNENNSKNTSNSIANDKEIKTEFKFGSSDYIYFDCKVNGQTHKLGIKCWGDCSYEVDDMELFRNSEYYDENEMSDLVIKEYNNYLNSTSNLTTEMLVNTNSDYYSKLVDFINEKINDQGFHFNKVNISGINFDEQTSKLVYNK